MIVNRTVRYAKGRNNTVLLRNLHEYNKLNKISHITKDYKVSRHLAVVRKRHILKRSFSETDLLYRILTP
jgi:hypothetical protein